MGDLVDGTGVGCAAWDVGAFVDVVLGLLGVEGVGVEQDADVVGGAVLMA